MRFASRCLESQQGHVRAPAKLSLLHSRSSQPRCLETMTTEDMSEGLRGSASPSTRMQQRGAEG